MDVELLETVVPIKEKTLFRVFFVSEREIVVTLLAIRLLLFVVLFFRRYITPTLCAVHVKIVSVTMVFHMPDLDLHQALVSRERLESPLEVLFVKMIVREKGPRHDTVRYYTRAVKL